MKRVQYASKRRSFDFRLTSVAQKGLCLSSLITKGVIPGSYYGYSCVDHLSTVWLEHNTTKSVQSSYTFQIHTIHLSIPFAQWFACQSWHSFACFYVVSLQVKKAVKSQGARNSIKNSKTILISIEDEAVDVDESNTSFDIIDSGSNNGDDDEIDEDDFDCGAVADDPIRSFSDLNPDSFGEIVHGTYLDISKQKENSLSNKTDLVNGKMVEHSNGSEIIEVHQAEEFSSHSEKENSSNDDNGHTGSNDDDDEEYDSDTSDNKSYAYKDLQCRSVEGEAHAVKSDSESDSSVELTRPRFR